MRARELEVERQNAERQLQRLEQLRECIICRDRPRKVFSYLASISSHALSVGWISLNVLSLGREYK